MHLARTHVHWVERVNEIIYAQIKSTKFSNNPNLSCWFRITWNSLQSFPLKRQAILRATWATRLTTCSQVFVNNTSSTWGAASLSFGHRSYLTRLPASREKQRPDLRLTGQGVQESYSQKLKNNKCRPWPCRYHSLHLQLLLRHNFEDRRFLFGALEFSQDQLVPYHQNPPHSYSERCKLPVKTGS